MIFIVVKFPVKPEYTEKWLDLTRDFTEATRAEPGNKWFEWSRSVEDPNEFVLVEAFEDELRTFRPSHSRYAPGSARDSKDYLPPDRR